MKEDDDDDEVEDKYYVWGEPGKDWVRNHQSSKNFENFRKICRKIQIILEKHKEKNFERGLNEIRKISTIGHF